MRHFSQDAHLEQVNLGHKSQVYWNKFGLNVGAWKPILLTKLLDETGVIVAWLMGDNEDDAEGCWRGKGGDGFK